MNEIKYTFDWKSFDHKDLEDLEDILSDELSHNERLREKLENYYEEKHILVKKGTPRIYTRTVLYCGECSNYICYDDEIICKKTFSKVKNKYGINDDCPLEELR